MKRTVHPASIALLAAMLAAPLMPIHAQSAAPEPRECRTFSMSPAEDEIAQLYVACGNAAAPLGQVDEHTLIELPSLDAALVSTTLYGTERIWLVMPKDEGGLSVEDLTDTLARLSGRTKNKGVADLDLELRAAGNPSPIGLLRSAERQAGKSQKVQIDIGQLVQNSRELRARQRAASND